ncbi:hypothetical protein D9M71_495470 [compost metagenome]
MGAAQVFQVVGRAGDQHVVRIVEAVAAGFATGLLGEDLAVDHVVAEEHHQPLGRTDELVAARGPAHALGNRQLVQRGFDDARQQVDGRLAGDGLAELQLRAAAVDLLDVDAALAGEAQGGLGRLAFGIEGGLYRRTIEVDGAVRLLHGELVDLHGQAARRGVAAGGGVAEAGGLQALLDAGEEGFAEALQRFRRQLFGAQFNQEILRAHYSASFSLASTSSRSSGAAIGKPRRARACR